MWLVFTVRDYLLVVVMYCIGVLCGVLVYGFVCLYLFIVFRFMLLICLYNVIVLYVRLLCRLCS